MATWLLQCGELASQRVHLTRQAGLGEQFGSCLYELARVSSELALEIADPLRLLLLPCCGDLGANNGRIEGSACDITFRTRVVQLAGLLLGHGFEAGNGLLGLGRRATRCFDLTLRFLAHLCHVALGKVHRGLPHRLCEDARLISNRGW